jgi:general secretion pathway protein D
MKTGRGCAMLVLLVMSTVAALAQGDTPAERKAFREYTSPQELVSIAPTTPLDKALAAISDVSNKFIGKVVIDPERRTLPTNVDIKGMQWRDALEAICRKNGFWYTEFENYIQLTGTEGAQAQAGGGAGGVDIAREPATFKSREVKISAVFFEVNLGRLEEVGLDWSFMKSTKDATVAADFRTADKVSDKAFGVQVTPKISFANIDVIAQLFSSYSLGEILSGPQIVVRSGEQGRIQVGQDFSIKERDFAGNLLDRFYSAGTIINVKPQVINDRGVNFVHMVVDVERSSVTPGAVSTIINKTKANTNLLLLDGEETVIGGLYNNEVSTVRSGVPFLKDLPWYVLGLKYLFGYDKDQVTKKELIILLKADLVPTLQERITQKVQEDHVFDRWREERQQEEQRIRGRVDH